MDHSALPLLPDVTPHVLSPEQWQARAQAHRERVQAWTHPWRDRRSRGESHPGHDFLFQYYMYSTGLLETWHPAPHEALVDTPDARSLFRAPTYRVVSGVIARDARALPPRQRTALVDARHMLTATRDRAANFGCFGVHEWAMVYRGHNVRHAEIAPLRLSQAEVDAFVESRPIVCSHFDASRFFAPDTVPLNRVQLTKAARHERARSTCRPFRTICARSGSHRCAWTRPRGATSISSGSGP
jgi:hypothetical protein